MAATRLTKLDVQKALSTFRVIRVHIEAMPFGLGNQASSLKMMKRLRQLGFRGKFECVYFKDRTHKIKEKVARLFDLPADFSDLYYDAKSDIEFIEGEIYLNEFNQDKIKKHPLSIAGGAMPFCVDGMITNAINITFNHALTRSPCKDETKILVSHVYLRVQPYMGQNPRNAGEAEIIYASSTAKKGVRNSKNQFLISPIETLDEALDYLFTTAKGANLAEVLPGLIPLINAKQKNNYYWVPAHGWPIQLPERNVNVQSHFPIEILHYIAGIRLAQQKLSLNKPIIIPVFYDYEEESKVLDEIFNQENSTAYKNFIATAGGKAAEELFSLLNLKGHFKISNLKNDFLEKTLDELTANDILLLSTDVLPNVIFNGLYFDDKQVLTYIFEGENTRNTLLSHSRIPYLRSLSWNFANFDRAPKNATLRASYEAYDQKMNFVEKVHWVSDFVCSAQDKNSEVSKYFNDLFEEANREENDRFLNVLKEAIALLPETEDIYSLNSSLVQSSTAAIYSFFQQMSDSFNTAIANVENEFARYMQDVTKSCPNYFPVEHPNFWNSSTTHSQFSCAEGLFKLNNRCISQPVPLNIGYKGIIKGM